jgi:hypothetical protein
MTDINQSQPCWINTVDPKDASPELSVMYQHVGAVHDKIHNLYRAFSIQPKPLIAADQHYRDILHNVDNERGEQILNAVREDHFDDNPLFTDRQAALLKYGAKLCRTPEAMQEQDVIDLKSIGISDTEILEAVQSTACFAYWVRFINALGINLGNESIGMYSDDEE